MIFFSHTVLNSYSDAHVFPIHCAPACEFALSGRKISHPVIRKVVALIVKLITNKLPFYRYS